MDAVYSSAVLFVASCWVIWSLFRTLPYRTLSINLFVSGVNRNSKDIVFVWKIEKTYLSVEWILLKILLLNSQRIFALGFVPGWSFYVFLMEVAINGWGIYSEESDDSFNMPFTIFRHCPLGNRICFRSSKLLFLCHYIW